MLIGLASAVGLFGSTERRPLVGLRGVGEAPGEEEGALPKLGTDVRPAAAPVALPLPPRRLHERRSDSRRGSPSRVLLPAPLAASPMARGVADASSVAPPSLASPAAAATCGGGCWSSSHLTVDFSCSDASA